jgi:23S rRNA G2445 N2-methylase RlmL
VAQKVLVELASFDADSEAALVDQLAQLPFEQHLDERTTFAVEAHLIRAPWDHTLYAAQRVKDVIVDRMRDRGKGRPSVDVKDPKVRFVLHWDGARVSFSKDLVGVPLFKRGYRREQGEAPMKETLAAAILAIVHADVTRPFLDPCCGSGTIAIEQALRMLDRAPSIGRHFAFERWPTTDDAMRTAVAQARAEAKARAKKKPDAPIRLSDWHPKAIAAAEANIAAAGLTTWLQVERVDARKVLSPGDRPVVVTNLPFGERLAHDKKLQLEGFYRTLGAHLGGWPGARLAFFSSQRDAERLLGLPGRPRRWALSSGALDATLLRYDLDGRSDPAAG